MIDHVLCGQEKEFEGLLNHRRALEDLRAEVEIKAFGMEDFKPQKKERIRTFRILGWHFTHLDEHTFPPALSFFHSFILSLLSLILSVMYGTVATFDLIVDQLLEYMTEWDRAYLWKKRVIHVLMEQRRDAEDERIAWFSRDSLNPNSLEPLVSTIQHHADAFSSRLAKASSK
jgi:hypothetical protein